jgi:hypothetical protein
LLICSKYKSSWGKDGSFIPISTKVFLCIAVLKIMSNNVFSETLVKVKAKSGRMLKVGIENQKKTAAKAVINSN